ILEESLGDPAHRKRKARRIALLVLLPGMLLTGCSTMPADKLLLADASDEVTKQVMERNDRVIHVSPGEAEPGKPVLLLLHGATDDPREMISIVRRFRGQYDVFLYCYN